MLRVITIDCFNLGNITPSVFARFAPVVFCQTYLGKHHCPQKKTTFDAETTNHHYYKPYSITAQKN
jgi:hypothetical protein